MSVSLPPPEDLFYFLIAFALLALLIVLTEVLRKRFGIGGETTRKLVHISTGLFIFIAPYFFKSNFYPALIPAIFIPFNILAVRLGWLRSLHGRGLESDGNRSYGTVYFPVAFLLLTLLCWGRFSWVLQTSMLVLGLADAFAALVGENLRKPHRYQLSSSPKSLEGSLAMFVTTAVIVFTCFGLFKSQTTVIGAMGLEERVLLAFSVALIATAVEALLSSGLDNLFVPLSVAYILTITELNGAAAASQLMLGVGISLAFVLGAFAVKFLNASGSTATFLLASTIFGMGGFVWTVPILTFFILSSLLSKAGKARKKKYDLMFEKTSQRDAGQVVANGGIAWTLMIFYSYFPYRWVYIAYLGTLAAVQADTWATEIGTMVRNPKPYSVVTFKPVPAGTSGGVTLIGTLGGVLGAMIICASAWLSNRAEMMMFGAVISFAAIGAAGAAGSYIDSLLGATLQSQYFDPARGKITERKFRETPQGAAHNELQKGYEWIDNDMVNFACGLAGAFIAVLLMH
ncbi:MAG: DUF92 domain-containing protein [Rhizobacter sp.]|nr:DUF92 domain-containing protein [Chlorobiales bacterium]